MCCRLIWGDRALAVWSCCDWRCWLALCCKPWRRNHCRFRETLEEHQLKSQSQGCICRPKTPVSFNNILDVYHGARVAMVMEERVGLQIVLGLHQSFHVHCAQGIRQGLHREVKTSLQVSPSQACLYAPWGLKGPLSPKGMHSAKRRRVPLGKMGKGLLVIITDSHRNACDATKCDHKKRM